MASAELAAQAVAEGLAVTVSASTVRRWLAQDAIRPWQHRSWIFPRDPGFAAKAARVLDLYQRVWGGIGLGDDEYVISADEKSQLQAVSRCHPELATGPGRLRRVEFEYDRHGTLAYFGAYDVHRAVLMGREPEHRLRHTSEGRVTVETGARSRNDRRSLLTATELPDPLAGPAGRPYMTEALDRPTRALQTAELAHTEGADDELVIAAAPPTSGAPNWCSTPTPTLPHELAGGALSSTMCPPCATSRPQIPRYQLNPTSIITSARQGGRMTAEQVARFGQQPWARDALSPPP